MARGISLMAAVVVAGALGAGMVMADGGAATAPATTEAAATAPASPLFTEIMTQYMDGKWDVLEKTLKEKVREIGGLEKEEQAAVVTIRLALREGRPEWWAVTKAGTKGQIKVSLWGRTIPVRFDPSVKSGADIKLKNGMQALSVGWPSGDMDSGENAGHGFTKGDAASLTAFANLGNVDSASQVSKGASEIQMERYLEFRGKATGMSYGTPGARRYGMWLCLASFTEENPKSQTRMARRAIGTMFMEEVLTHPESFPSVPLPKTLAADKTEGTLGLLLADVVEKHPWTFAEDNMVKAAVKSLAATNGTKAFNAGTITLPNKLSMALDAHADDAMAAARSAWIKAAFDKAAGK